MPFLEGGRDRLDTEKKILEGYTPTECLTLRTGLWRLCSLLHMLLTEQVFMSSHPENRVTEFPLTVLTTRHSPPPPRGCTSSPVRTGPWDSSPLRGPSGTCCGKPRGQRGTQALVSGNPGLTPWLQPATHPVGAPCLSHHALIGLLYGPSPPEKGPRSPPGASLELHAVGSCLLRAEAKGTRAA